MKGLLLFIIFVMFLGLSPRPVSAQGMMGAYGNPTSIEQAQTTQDELAGKAIWDKLQSSQVSCSSLKDSDFDVLGDFFMGGMMGSNHAAMNQLLAQRLGDDGEKQMHIALAKRLSGCNTNAAFPTGANYFMPMMGFSGAGMMNTDNGNSWGGIVNGMMGNSFGIFGLLTWIAITAFFLLGSIYFLRGLLNKKSK